MNGSPAGGHITVRIFRKDGVLQAREHVDTIEHGRWRFRGREPGGYLRFTDRFSINGGEATSTYTVHTIRVGKRLRVDWRNSEGTHFRALLRRTR